MHLSIVVPVYNEARSLPSMLRHLRAMPAQAVAVGMSIDVVLVDAGSDDGSRDLLRASGLPWISTDRGRARQMNSGAAATRGDALLFLHADTNLPVSALESIRTALDSGHVAGFFRVALQSRRPVLRLVGRLISARSHLTGIATGDQAIFVRRDEFDALGGFAPLPLFEDVELMRRLRDRGRLARLQQTVTTSARRWEEHGPWRVIFRMWLLRALYYCGLSPERLARYYGAAR